MNLALIPEVMVHGHGGWSRRVLYLFQIFRSLLLTLMVLRINTSGEMLQSLETGLSSVLSDSNQRKLYHYEANVTNGSLQYLNQIVPNSTSNNQANDFGQAFALDRNSIVGAKNAYVNNMSSAGAIYLFDFNGSTPNQIARITASDGSSSDYLGISVDISDNLIAGGHMAVLPGTVIVELPTYLNGKQTVP